MVLYMIYGHICLWASVEQLPIITNVLFFFMPWFFFKSGMFYKSTDMKSCITKGIQRLMIPYVSFTIIGTITFWIMWWMQGNDDYISYILHPLRTLLHNGAVLGNSPLWFLLTLFVVRIIFNITDRYGKAALIPISLVCITGAYLLNKYEVNSYLYVANICSGTFFFTCGYLFKDWQHRKWMIATSIIAYILIIVFIPSYFDFRSNSGDNTLYFSWVISSLCGIIVFNGIFRLIPIKYYCLSYIGRNSMVYFVAHWVVLGWANIIFRFGLCIDDNWTMFTIYVVMNVICLPLIDMLLSKKWGIIIGK